VYVCIGREICPDTGRPHFHAHIKFNRDRKGSWIMENISRTAHRDIIPTERVLMSVAYCKKGDDSTE